TIQALNLCISIAIPFPKIRNTGLRNNNKKDYAMSLFRSALLIIVTALPFSATALPIYETVLPNQFFSVDFKFKTDTGDADVLEANGGGTALGLLGSNIELFVNNKLVSSWLNPMSNTFAIFKDPGSNYTAWGATIDLADIFNG